MKKKTIADLSREYEDLYYSDEVYNKTGKTGYELRWLIQTIRTRLSGIEEWARALDGMRIARHKREEAIKELKGWNCLPSGYRDKEWLNWIEKTDLHKFVEIIKERGELLKVNRIAKQAAADIEASNKTRYY